MFHKMNCRMILVLSIVLFVGSAFSLRCYVCETDLCNDLKKLEPRNCTREVLKNVGPGMMNFTQMPFNTEITGAEPPFDCQKVEATDTNGKVHVARRCQVRLPAHQTCDHFTRTIGYERDYRNASCSICSTDACNTAQSIQVWSMLLAPAVMLTVLFMILA